MISPPSLADHFLIAMPALDDPNFQRTVTLVCQHDADGAMGIVINRLADYTLGDLLDQLQMHTDDTALAGQAIVAGGPVHPDRGFVLHGDDSEWNSTLRIAPGLSVTTSRDILEALSRGEGPRQVLVALGYAGWEAGQLEAELAQNSWLTVPAEQAIVFDTPLAERWQAAAGRLGVDLSRLADYSGRA